VRLERQDHVVEPNRLSRHAHHSRHAEAPDVRVQDADAIPVGRERAREVHGDAGLADAALARGHGDHDGVAIGEERALLLLRGPAAELGDEARALLLAHRGERDLDPGDALERRERRGDVVRDAVLQRAALDRDQDVHPHEAALDLDALEHADVFDRAPDLGVVHASERLADLVLGDDLCDQAGNLPGLS
jgi:hypothetical protein